MKETEDSLIKAYLRKNGDYPRKKSPYPPQRQGYFPFDQSRSLKGDG